MKINKIIAIILIISSFAGIATANEAGEEYTINMEDFSLELKGETIVFDGVFNSIHGTPGEDGKLLAYFEMLEIPYSSSDVDVSSLTFNKYLCNTFVMSLGVNVAKSFSFLKGETIKKEEIIDSLGFIIPYVTAKDALFCGVFRDELSYGDS